MRGTKKRGAALLLALLLAMGLAGGCDREPDPSVAGGTPPGENGTPSPSQTGGETGQPEPPDGAGAAEPSPSPEPSPAPTEEELRAARAAELLAGMDLREKVCQLFVVYPQTLARTGDVTGAEELADGLAEFPVGGLILDKRHLVSRDQVAGMLAGVQELAEIPLLLTCDEEGGRVNRLMSTVGTTYIGPMLGYKDQGTDTAFENARTIAADMAALGFNLDLAPVADVWSDPANTVIGDRAYSDDFQQAAELVAAAVEGFHAGGVGCTLKHFPGHGDTSADSHYGSVYVYKTLEELRQEELLPFRAGIDAGADCVMMGHLIVADVDGEPALFSHELVTGLLREELGFDGVVMTDSLEMQAMTDHYGSGEIAVRAVAAGVDILLCPLDLAEAVAALEGAVADGTINEERIDESVTRILELKLRWGIVE